MKPGLDPSRTLFAITVVLAIVIHFPVLTSQGTQPFDTCGQSVRCGNIEFQYPFWGLNRPDYCGHPGFKLNCQSNVTELVLESVNYRVLDIDSSTHTITLARNDLWSGIWPQYIHETRYDPTLFDRDNYDQETVSLYYGCDDNASIPLAANYRLSCNVNQTQSDGYFYRTSLIDPEIAAFMEQCNNNITVPVDTSFANITSESDLRSALRAGFKLQWMANNDDCDRCVRSNGRCGSNSTSPELFACYKSGGVTTGSTRITTVTRSSGTTMVTVLSETMTKTESAQITVKGFNATTNLPQPTTYVTNFNSTSTPITRNETSPTIYVTPSNRTTTITRSNGTTTVTGSNGTTTVTGSNETKTETGSDGTTTKTGSKGTTRKLVIGISSSIAGIIFMFFVILYQKKRLCIPLRGPESENHQIEIFIRNHGRLAPRRYKYSEIKKMTNSFQDKLGQGGYGSVYKGQLPNGHLVAVKLLNKATGNGEDFINEVASISRTSHVNIVTLLGFCFEGKKRALLYEFMPNGSLDKFLWRDDSHLDWNTLLQIAKGIARGLEYLHRGCNTRIVHFDIKPHNILLDEEFVPKISDFGLAKFCKKKESIVSVMGARGTAGYMAPEVFFRSLGGASHKSDVYSYGMMVLEMTGASKSNNSNKTNTNTNTSEAYFPDWIYKQLEVEGNLGDKTVEEEELARKMMIMVSLWCIQSNPSDRPSISKVVEMLEGSIESLQVPPRRFESSPTRAFQGNPASFTESSSSERVSTMQENISLLNTREANKLA
ncbi:hypothetical protein R6Q57_021177 [Mikania cordata]